LKSKSITLGRLILLIVEQRELREAGQQPRGTICIAVEYQHCKEDPGDAVLRYVGILVRQPGSLTICHFLVGTYPQRPKYAEKLEDILRKRKGLRLDVSNWALVALLDQYVVRFISL
jgi:hypothetical protein